MLSTSTKVSAFEPSSVKSLGQGQSQGDCRCEEAELDSMWMEQQGGQKWDRIHLGRVGHIAAHLFCFSWAFFIIVMNWFGLCGSILLKNFNTRVSVNFGFPSFIYVTSCSYCFVSLSRSVIVYTLLSMSFLASCPLFLSSYPRSSDLVLLLWVRTLSVVHGSHCCLSLEEVSLTD